jgi:hypothetical protein
MVGSTVQSFITVHNGIYKLKVSNTSFIHILLTISLDKMVELLNALATSQHICLTWNGWL